MTALELIAKEKKEKTGKLDLSFKKIKEVPEEITDLTWLQSIDLRSNKINDISFLSKLSNLQTINLSYNQINDYSFLSKLSNLQGLDLRSNEINDISFLEKLNNLQALDLSYNQINDYVFLSKLSNLQTLVLRSNKISDISFVSNLINLQTLDLRSNQIIDLSFLSNLINLQTLNLRSNQIKGISFLEKLKNLQALGLGSNQINDISFLEKLNNLQTLDLDSNQINDYNFLSKLSNLQNLFLSSNQINDYSFLSKLSNLQSLFLSSNHINDYSFLSNLINLQTLDLNSNQINDVSFLSKLSNLQSLDLSYNQISNISFLEKLSNLQSLDLRDNQIRNLTPLKHLIINKGLEIKLEGSLEEIMVAGNPITAPPLEIVKKGREAVVRYFEDIEESGEDFLYEAKLLIVGEPGAGKTSLYRKLVNENAKLPKKDETTRGIDIHEYHFKTAQKKDFRINLWDFGGQVIMYFAHQFFLTANSLYILVTDGRQENSNFKYWLHVIDLLGKDSKIIVVQNEVGNRVHRTNLNDYVSRFKNIVFTKSLNLDKDLPRIRSLRKKVEEEIQKIPSIGKPLPKRWIQVREKIKAAAETDDIIDCNKYFELCKTEGIKDKDKALKLSEDLHSLGVFLHFQKDPILRNTLILNNNWATGAVYSLVDNKFIKTTKKGQFTENDFSKIWNDDRFVDKYFEIIQLLKNFNIIYEIPDTRKRKYIIPQLLPEKKPEYAWDDSMNIKVYFKYEFMPKGIISNFVVRMHRYIYNQQFVWRYGVLLEREKTMAEVIENELDQSINIKIRGHFPQDFMTIIVEEIDKINRKFQEIKVEKYVPCNCDFCAVIDDPTFFKYSDLKDRLRVNNPNALKIQCKNLQYDFVDVKSLMESIVILDEKKEKLTKEVDEKENGIKPLKVFISYSKEDQNHLESLDKFLVQLKREKIIEPWHDRKLIAGEPWKNKIKTELETMDAIIFLVTQNFIATDFINNVEIKKAIKRYKKGEVQLIPIIVDHCDWQHNQLAEFTVLPEKGKPIQAYTNKNKAWQEVLNGIRESLKTTFDL